MQLCCGPPVNSSVVVNRYLRQDPISHVFFFLVFPPNFPNSRELENTETDTPSVANGSNRHSICTIVMFPYKVAR